MQASRITPPLMGVGKTRAQPAVEPVGGQPRDLRGLSTWMDRKYRIGFQESGGL